MKTAISDLVRGIWRENPVLVLLLGTCPTMALTTNAVNGVGMGLAVTCVLLGSNTVSSLMRNLVPEKIHIPVYIVVIATFVTIIDLLMKAYAPAELYEALGIFIPLIVVNCIVLGRAEAFASKHGPLRSAADGVGMGLGFTVALVMIGCIREFLTSGSVFSVKLIECWTTDFLLPSSPAGAFIIVGSILGIRNYLAHRAAVKSGREYENPPELDCRHCAICKIDRNR
ncbi:MAG: electron transport complex subunit E [Victivallaceae bacterium]|nr:electron transport complex subunit E [Victivallaceae bacterium]